MNLMRSVLAILILFIPLYPKFPLLNVTGTYVAIRLDDIVISFSLLVFLYYQLKHHFPILKLKINRLFLIYFLAIIASNLTALFIYQTTPFNLLLLHLLRRFEYMSLFFIAVSAVKTPKDLSFPYYFLLLCVTLVSFYGYGQKFYHLPIISTMNKEFSKGQLLEMDFWSRISSTFAGHYDLAAFMSSVLIIVFSLFLISKSILTKFLSLLVYLIGFYILTLTASRISVFAFWGGIIVALIFIRKYLWIIPVSAMVIASILSSKDLNQRLLATIPALQQQIFPRPKITPTVIPTLIPTPTLKIIAVVPIIPVKPIKIVSTPTPTPSIFRHKSEEEVFPPIDADIGVARSGEIRFNAEWPRAITAFNKNRLTGTGLGSITLATDNDYLRLLGESGLLGFISFLAIIFYFIKRTIFSKRTNPLSYVLFAALISFMFNAFFIDVIEASKTAYMFWIMMGIYYQTLQWSKKS